MQPQGFIRKRRIGELLADQGIIGSTELERALGEQKRTGKRIGETMVILNFLSESELAQGLSSQLGFPFLNLDQTEISPEALLLVPESLARKYLVVPVQVERKHLTVAMVDPLSYEAINDLVFCCGYSVRPVISTPRDILRTINRFYHVEGFSDDIAKIQREGEFGFDSPNRLDNNQADELARSIQHAPVVRMVNGILDRAIHSKASDIHLEPRDQHMVVRFRVDGLLQRVITLPKWSHGPLTSRIKVLSKLDIAEKRLPQDGTFRVPLKGQGIDIRVATLPTQYGEKVVMRILDSSQSSPSLDGLGFSDNAWEKIKRQLSHRSGIILVTGPTGCGKTTTLYAMINALRDESNNIVTVEDPIEYCFEGINQTQVNPEIGLSFATCLRSILRQDPNIILLGEIRDLETAEVAFRAAMTGHLVLSTLHTRDAASSVIRLIDLGVPPYLVSSLLVGVIAQRLVRSLCSFCRIEDVPGPSLLLRLGLQEKNLENYSFYRGQGCQGCGEQGYKGRLGLFEIMELGPRIRDLILKGCSGVELREEAISQGMSNLGEEGLKKVKTGQTSLSELYRVIDVENHMPVYCQGCGETLSSHFRSCPLCGLSLNFSCRICGKTLRSHWKICPYCSGQPG
jgi:type IV pilus assembly protein PilB